MASAGSCRIGLKPKPFSWAGTILSNGFDVMMVNNIKPIDINLINEISNQFKLIVTLEDNVIAGGAGSAVNEELIALNSSSNVLNLGLPDGFIEHGDQEQQKIMNNLDGIGVRKAIEQKLKSI